MRANRFLLALNGTLNGLWDWSLGKPEYFYVTPLFKEIIGVKKYRKASFPDAWFEVLHEDDCVKFQQALTQEPPQKVKEMLFDQEYRIKHPGEEYRWIKCRWLTMFNEDSTPRRHIGLIRDITPRKRNEEALIHHAYHDPLTGLPNRSLLKDRLDQILLQFKLTQESAFAFAFVDVDHFKMINDQFGHQVGDDVLIELSSRLRGRLRSKDTVARFGGDEFGIILNDIRTIEDLHMIFNKFVKTDSNKIILGQEALDVSLSVGITFVNIDNIPDSVDEVIKQADIALYASKNNGRNRFTIHNEHIVK